MVNSVNLKASVSFVGDGSTNRFYFGFDYINKQFVKVQVGADNPPLTYLTDYTVDDRSVTLTNTPDVGVAIRVYRETPSDRIVEWADGAFIKASQMTLENLQQLHLIEEAHDYPILNSMSKYPDGFNFNALGSRIAGVSDPKDPQDVVTKHYMENVQGGFVAANTKILNDAKDTLNATQQTQSKAQENETLSKAWSTSTESPDNADDTQSSTGKTQSSRSWALYSKEKAQEAATSATKAKTSETNAKTSETNAKASETKAATSEANAKTSETNAKTSETKVSASASASASSASASATSATNAKTSETNAKDSETKAATSAASAESSNQQSKKWAVATDSPDGETDTGSSTGKTQSARSWALSAKDSADDASKSATTAVDSATNAESSAAVAKASETSAIASATSAKSWAEDKDSPNGVADTDSPTGRTQSAKSWALAAQTAAVSASAHLDEINRPVYYLDSDGYLCEKMFVDETDNAEPPETDPADIFKNLVVNTLLPVGSILEFINDTDPNELYPSTTWVKMDAGRVLISAGTYTEKGTTYTYNLGDKGGEVKHTITVDEMAAHDHKASCSTAGNHHHDFSRTNSANPDNGVTGGGAGHWETVSTNDAGSHVHTITIAKTGGNVPHENRQPFEVINRWKRTA